MTGDGAVSEPLQPVEIRPVSPDRMLEGLLLAFGSLSPANQAARVESILAEGGAEGPPLDGLRVAKRGDRLVGAVFAQEQPGRSAIVWPPTVMPNESEETRNRLLASVNAWLAQRNVRMASMLFDSEEVVEERLASAGGFQRLASIAYMISGPEDWPEEPAPVEFAIERVLPSRVDRWHRVLEATYVQTLDCPGLEELRPPEDVLTGYEAAGPVRSEFWMILKDADRDVGCLILVDHPQQNMAELAYMGLVPGVRGRGWGRRVAQLAQETARAAGRDKLLVGVDVRNLPAWNAYTACGFREWDRKVVFVRQF